MSAGSERGGGDEDGRVGQLLGDRYLLEAHLGTGGMGSIYRAQHVHMKKTVAIKILHRELTASLEAVRRFEREAVAVANVTHPNVAAATDFGKLEDGTFYLALEYVPGKSLLALLEEHGALPVERALAIARQIAEALGAAHAAGIVHRDLKPENVMLLERSDAPELVKVLDFGIAKVRADEKDQTQLTQAGTVFGTPQYMSPEQAAGEAIDARADLYALGLVLYEMLAGRPTFSSPEILTVLTQQLTAPPPPLPSHVPGPVQALVFQLLEKKPQHRPATALEVVARIDASSQPRTNTILDAITSPHVARRLGSEIWGPIRRRAHPLWLRLQPFTRRWFRRAVTLGRLRTVGGVPLWVVGAGIFGSAFGLVLLVLLTRSNTEPDLHAASAEGTPNATGGVRDTEESSGLLDRIVDFADGTKRSPASQDKVDPALLRVIEQARLGSDVALFALEQRSESERGAREWLALAEGYLRAARRGKTRERVQKSLEAYKEALENDAQLTHHGALLSGLRHYATEEETFEPVLAFSAEHLKQNGADLLFDVWASTSQKTPATRKAEELLRSRSVAAHHSEPLRLALELREPKSCEELARLMPKVTELADRRSVFPLETLEKTEGCGPDGKDDCYPCLRGSSALEEALTQARIRKTPAFDRRRWR